MGKTLKSKKRQRRRARRAEALALTGIYYICDYSYMTRVGIDELSDEYYRSFITMAERNADWKIVSRGHSQLDMHDKKSTSGWVSSPPLQYRDLIIQSEATGNKYWAQSRFVRRLI